MKEISNNRFPFYIVCHENKFRILDLEADLFFLHYVYDLDEKDAKNLLLQDKAVLFLFKAPDEVAPEWIDRVRAAIITIDKLEAETLKEFFQMDFTVKKFNSKKEFYDWASASAERKMFHCI